MHSAFIAVFQQRFFGHSALVFSSSLQALMSPIMSLFALRSRSIQKLLTALNFVVPW